MYCKILILHALVFKSVFVEINFSIIHNSGIQQIILHVVIVVYV